MNSETRNKLVKLRSSFSETFYAKLFFGAVLLVIGIVGVLYDMVFVLNNHSKIYDVNFFPVIFFVLIAGVMLLFSSIATCFRYQVASIALLQGIDLDKADSKTETPTPNPEG